MRVIGKTADNHRGSKRWMEGGMEGRRMREGRAWWERERERERKKREREDRETDRQTQGEERRGGEEKRKKEKSACVQTSVLHQL